MIPYACVGTIPRSDQDPVRSIVFIYVPHKAQAGEQKRMTRAEVGVWSRIQSFFLTNGQEVLG